MKAIMVEEIGSYRFTQVSVREPGPDEVLIKVKVTGLCRTDLKIIRVGHRDLVLPRIPGEEVVGEIIAKGIGVDLLGVGDLVYVYPGQWCKECPACLNEAENLCRRMQIMGFHRDGGFAEYVTAPAQSLIPVPAGLAADEAVFAEPLSCCLNALELGGIDQGMKVGIWGAGPAGTLLRRLTRAFSAEPFTVDPDARRRELVGGYEKFPDDILFDIGIVAVGDQKAYAEALQKLGPRGCLIVFSGLPPGQDQVKVNFNQLHYHEQKLAGAYGCSYRHGLRALEFINSGKVAVKDMISHRMSLEDLGEALELVADKAGMKILLYP
jgi:L-iditol 2-dehydrogenase